MPSAIPVEKVQSRPPLLLRPLVGLPMFVALRYPQFRLIWGAQFGNSMGINMDLVARGWLMYDLTGSTVELGLVLGMRLLPGLLLAPLAGVLADRSNRKLQLISAQMLNALLNWALAFLVIFGHVQTWHVYLTGFLVAIVQVFEMPARQAMVSESVDRQHLTNAIGLNSIAWNISQSLGPAVAGVLIAVMGVGGSYIVQGVIYAISTVWTVQLSIGGQSFADRRANTSLYRGVIDGWGYILRHPTIRGAMTMAVLISLFGISFTVLLPAFARDILDVGATGQGLLVTASGIGAFAGSICIAAFGDRLPKGRLMLGGALLFGLTEIAFGFSTWFPISFLLMAMTGLTGLTCTALVNTVLQGHSDPGMRGRVMAAFQQAHQGMTIGGLFIGALAAVVGPPVAVAWMGAACCMGVLAIALTQPNIRAIRE